MKILACPIDKHHPLELYEISHGIGEKDKEDDTGKKDTVLEGALYCGKCSRFYPIMEGIPVMLPDDLRDQKQELDFLASHAQKLPEKITASANPWHL